MDFKTLFAKELEAGTSVEDILRSVANAANVYEEEQKKKNDEADAQWCAAADVITSLLDYAENYTDLKVEIHEDEFDTIVKKFIQMMDTVKIFKLW